MKIWQTTLSRAASGATDAATAVKLLQLNATQLKSLTLEEQLKAIADQFRRIKDPADQTRVAVELFGRAGEQLVPLLKQGGAAIEELTRKADELGITLDERTTKQAERSEKALKQFWATIKAGAGGVGGFVAQAFIGDSGELDAAMHKLEELKKTRDEIANPNWLAKFLGGDAKDNAALLANFNRTIDEQLRAVNAIQRRLSGDEQSPLKIPDISPITEAIINQQKAGLQGIAKLLDDFEKTTRTSEEKIYQDYKDTVDKITELRKANVINAEEEAKRIGDARLKYEQDVTIEPIDINAIEKQRVAIQKTLSEQQRSVDIFVDTVKEGLTNLAQSGELTGRSILKYLLASFESKALKDAIDDLGRYLKKSLGSGSGAGSFFGGLIDSIFGSDYISPVTVTAQRVPTHAAGGGSIGGMRIVGEDGPEVELSNGRILNKRQLQFAMAGMSGGINVQQGDVNVSTSATDPAAVAQYVSAVVQQNNKQLLTQLNARLKDNYGRALR